MFTIDFEPIGTRLICEEPVLLRDAAGRAGIQLRSVCGGKTTCGKCLVRVVSGSALSPVTEAERLLLSEAEIAAGYRQACRTLASGNLSVYVPPSSLVEEQKLQVEGNEETIEVDPVVRKFCLTVRSASLADQRSDFDRTADALRAQHHVELVRADLPTLTRLCAWECFHRCRSHVFGRWETRPAWGPSMLCSRGGSAPRRPDWQRRWSILN